jgi:hypothetical protein
LPASYGPKADIALVRIFPIQGSALFQSRAKPAKTGKEQYSVSMFVHPRLMVIYKVEKGATLTNLMRGFAVAAG